MKITEINFNDLQKVDISLQFPGVYCIHNKGKVYIGSSVNVYTRVRRHFKELENNKHKNVYLQRAYNLDNNFYAVLLEKVDYRCDLLKREQYWIDCFESYNSIYGYNLCKFAGSTLGIKRTDEEKKNLSEKLSGRKLSKETKEKISNSRKGIIFTDAHRKNISKALSGRKLPIEMMEKLQNNNIKTIYQYDLEGNYIATWKSASEVERKIGIDQSSIRKSCKGKLFKAGSFIWRDFYSEKLELNSKKIFQKNLQGNVVKVWDSVFDICSELNFNASAIYQCCIGNWEKYKGFKWSYGYLNN